MLTSGPLLSSPQGGAGFLDAISSSLISGLPDMTRLRPAAQGEFIAAVLKLAKAWFIRAIKSHSIIGPPPSLGIFQSSSSRGRTDQGKSFCFF